ncbi:phosphatidylinositol-4-phosphate 5-kinase [Fusobacterium animalis]|uniref:Phosphatidylinositol-4-phosphate 5-kinase n=1 Tax=Fusobacterium animalis TaxID=76859 RepID=A0A2B7YQ63_9FUSO|nr:phosphatidylinositol-4-phosphate 5-kinase [Fusobacterium animalis]
MKKNYREEYSKRKISPNNEYSFEIEDDGTSFFTRNINMNPKTEITQYFNRKGELYMISSLTSETEGDLYALYRKYDKEGNLSIYTYAIDGKNTDKGYYSDGKLAYIKELKIVKGEAPIQNGKYIEYYKNGQIKVQGHYKNGKREGEFKTFLRNSKNAGSIFYKNGKIIKSTLINSMKDNASFSVLTDINYNSNSHEIVTDEFPNGLLKQYFTFNKDELLDGESRQYYEEGDIKSISPFKNNVADGTFISYYQNGNIKEKHTYKNGNEEGEGIFYYENGKLEEKYFMKNGKLDGEAINYFEDGKIKNKAIFKDGVTLEEEIYKDNEIRKNTFKNGEIVQQDIYSKNKILKAKKFLLENGKMKIISYYENGNKQEEIFVMNELFDGDAFAYYPSGKLKEKDFFKNGKREGESIIYYENGNVKQKSLFKNNKREGDLSMYYPSGKLLQTEKYVNGKEEGEVIEYYESGAIKEKAHFINDKQEGEHLYYDEKGNLTKTEIYKNGIKQ